ncbi:FAD-binding oxidoreductase [Dyella caseinilytica]|uniref:FAD-binding oxidoreductase n=1 Tax=Dyella caseinilytica TaxID=1849581 RepID=A0ABX7GPH6_9GAMM|nr:FAD-binding protein [Dyella caseinilytica]QRN51973.1 FAD-binding oxidoreductase [Dyella caseinilytica]GGA04039.1 FAD-binding protein [Dyella caseinilytica]
MRRRDLLKAALAAPILPLALSSNTKMRFEQSLLKPRVRPRDTDWPEPAHWEELKAQVGGRLIVPQSPFAQGGAATAQALKYIHNPYYVGDEPGLTQTSGWFGAWTSQPSRYAVVAEGAGDMVAAVNFARKHRLRLVVKGGGHSYQGTSDAPDSLLVWTRRMRGIQHHSAFVGQGCEGHVEPRPAVTLGAGCLWMDAYEAVTTLGGRYVQGGGCPTVGVAGLVQSGGFGHYSKTFGSAASNLLEAEVVTADGQICIANACSHPDLFWGLKGGGGGSLGIVTRVTLRTFELPNFFGGVGGEIRAPSDGAYRELIARFFTFYQSQLFNPHWGEHITLRSDNVLSLTMMFQGLDASTVEHIWAPFLEWVRTNKSYRFDSDVSVLTLPAQHLWDGAYFQKHFPGHVRFDDRPGAPASNMLWDGEQNEVGRFIHGYRSAWLPAALLQPDRRDSLIDTLFDASRSRSIELYFGKGLAGGPSDALLRTRDTAMNPQVLDAFALAILGADADHPAYPGMPGGSIDTEKARRDIHDLDQAMNAIYRLVPDAGSYFSESDYFLRDWQSRFWGTNYPRLAAIKQRYDPFGLFVIHHGVGSEAWRDDGFTPVAGARQTL